MSLTLAYNIARGALTTGASLAAVVSSNVANADNADAARKSALVATGVGGAPYLSGIAVEVDRALLDRALESTSASGQSGAVAEVLDQLAPIIGDPNAERSPAALIANFRDALQTASAMPHDNAALQSVLTSADALAASLNEDAGLIAKVRNSTNSLIGEAVTELRKLLEELADVNSAIVSATARDSDRADRIDQRNGIVRGIAELVDLRVVVRGGDDLTLYLANGVTLFETSAREVVFDAGSPLLVGQPGPDPRIDGVSVGLGGGVGGRIGGLIAGRDETALKFGRQLDEIARGLIVATAERDQTPAAAGPDLAGLFTYPGGLGLPPAGITHNGLAGEIRVNAFADPARGGVLARIRDGGISNGGDPHYIYNPSAGTGFSGRLLDLAARIGAEQPFDATADLPASAAGVLGFAADSAGWFEAQRSSVEAERESASVLAARAVGAWQSKVGVNLDDELTVLIALERSYQASSRIVTLVNGMFDALLGATR